MFKKKFVTTFEYSPRTVIITFEFLFVAVNFAVMYSINFFQSQIRVK